jgi:hypothetical protein
MIPRSALAGNAPASILNRERYAAHSVRLARRASEQAELLELRKHSATTRASDLTARIGVAASADAEASLMTEAERS